MANYANQKRIRLGHLGSIAAKGNSGEAFLAPVRWDPLKAPMRILNGNAYKLWVYLLSWEGQGYYDFSPASIAKELNVSDQGARNAKQELIDKGYLTENADGTFEFYPISTKYI